VAASLSIYGALRKCELYALEMGDIRQEDGGYYIKVQAIKTDVTREFFIRDAEATHLQIYLKARPQDALDRLILTQRNGKIIKSVVGINMLAKFPLQIAEWLKLTKVNQFTGHAFRRTAATWAAESDMDMNNLRQLGGWQSDSIAQGYIAESDVGKRQRANVIRGKESSNKLCETPKKKPMSEEILTGAFNISGNFTGCTFNIVRNEQKN
jgi:integrase